MKCKNCGFLLDDDGHCGECEKYSISDIIDLAGRKEMSSKFNPVDRPFHYNHADDGIECIDYIKQVLGLDGFIDYSGMLCSFFYENGEFCCLLSCQQRADRTLLIIARSLVSRFLAFSRF